MPSFEAGDPNGAPNPLDVPAGEARAGRLSQDMLPEDPFGLAVWKPGDFVLASGAGYALLIESARVSDLYDRFGGKPVGIARIEGGRLVDPGEFNELIFGVSTFLLETQSVSVTNDGRNGQAAVIRAIGRMKAIDFLGSVPEAFRGGAQLEGFPAMVEYRMAPGASHVDFEITVGNPNPQGQGIRHVLFATFQAYRMPPINPMTGFEEPRGELEWIAYSDPLERTSWALVAPMGRSYRVLVPNISGVSVFSLGSVELPGCERTRIALGSIALGRGGNGAQATAIRLRGGQTRRISGQVFEADGTTPVPGVHVHAKAGGRYFSRTTSDRNGRFVMEVPMGSVELEAWRRGTPLSNPVMVPADASEATIRMPVFGTIEVQATLDGTPGPMRIQVLGASGTDVPFPPRPYGERPVTMGRVHVEFTPNGRASLRVSPGNYVVRLSRGYEYELIEQNVTVAGGGTAMVRANLRRVVDTPGWMCADYHIHTTRSPDSSDDAALKILGLVADGLELPIRSDHEFAADFQPVIERLGLEAWARGMAGEEITTWEWGHFGAFPLRVDPSMRNGHIPNIYGVRPREMVAELRSRPENPLLIINHPRGIGPGFAFFTVAGYDRTTGMVSRPEMWIDEFSVIEAFNDSSFEQNRNETVADWFSFLNRGRKLFVVGSSDSHQIYGSPVGYPRTCVWLGTDDPRAVTPEMVRDATAQGRSFVSGGIYLDVSAQGGMVRPGGTARGVGPMARLRVRVQAAEWIDVDSMELIVDGMTRLEMPLSRGPDPVILFDGELMVPVSERGSWAIVHVKGDEDMEKLHPGREPFAVSNPIFFER
ncbi:MAG: CehA/McbA family metallohydrolase [Sandaracinaceae bacterium]|nr:CehA/McbA family metallohydrolase [Sandaracinaceae bacterium]